MKDPNFTRKSNDQINKENEVNAKRKYWGAEVTRIQGLLSNATKQSTLKEKYKKELNFALDQVKEYAFLDKSRAINETNIFKNVVTDSVKKEIFNRIISEVNSRFQGNPHNVISLIPESEEEAIEQAHAVVHKHYHILSKLRELQKEIDGMTMEMPNSPEPMIYHQIIKFNLELGKMKRAISDLLK